MSTAASALPVFTKSVDLPVTPDEAFALVTQPERLRRWKTVAATVDLRAGGAYRWTVTPGHIAVGTFREIEPGKRIVYGWGWEGSPDLEPDASTVTLTIEPTDSGSRVTLVHEGLTEEQAVLHGEGWNHYFERLERFATTGDAGPDEWAAAPADLNPLTAAEASLAVLQPVLRALTAEDRPKPTPCSDFTCHELAEHLMCSLVGLGAMAGATVVNPEEGSLENRISVMASQAIDAWRARGLEGEVETPGGALPAAAGPTILALECLLHAWDFAQATGHTIVASDVLVDYVRDLGAPLIEGGRGRAFGTEHIAPDGTSALERLAAFSGRVHAAA
ncbi:MAG: TIGR03086 family metal-binding protein [Knoellia sp.]